MIDIVESFEHRNGRFFLITFTVRKSLKFKHFPAHLPNPKIISNHLLTGKRCNKSANLTSDAESLFSISGRVICPNHLFLTTSPWRVYIFNESFLNGTAFGAPATSPLKTKILFIQLNNRFSLSQRATSISSLSLPFRRFIAKPFLTFRNVFIFVSMAKKALSPRGSVCSMGKPTSSRNSLMDFPMP